ncbi:cupin domain-containing protein [Duganella sp. FT135W]|uniref:Cupin domain-containing protein n=1 Tax=Duganella flavida TaxID=2692175 RepID=A0A6L8KFU7_9BURK|nr:cupin domain-containing protein [Duganella flavida]MYM26276.1 cupin domain-containing protein [Duganella flavida]
MNAKLIISPLAFATTLVVTAFAAGAHGSLQAAEPTSKILLTQQFATRPVTKVEIGDFHFAPGQLAPKHTHLAPVFGYVSKGKIYYQVEGQEPVLLNAGDVFYEPVGPNIVHFDNASQTEEAVFTDINFERDGEPFIVFPVPLTEKIDRRSFPSQQPQVAAANTMNVYEQTLPAGGALPLLAAGTTGYGYVAQGSVSVRVRGEAPIVYTAGQTFYQPTSSVGTQVSSASTSNDTKVIRFVLSKH